MNTIRHILRSQRFFRAVLVASLLVAAKTYGQPFGQWDFNSSNLTATVGSALQYADGGGGPTEVATAFGTTAGFGIPNINGTNAIVMRFPAATNTMGYSMPTPSGNGGGSFVNEYTVIFDLLYPSNGIIRPLVDTDGTEFVAGADFAVNAAGGIGVTPSGPFDGTLAANTWNRVGFTVTGTEVRKYINGAQVGSQGHTLEGRLALTPNNLALILANTVGDAGLGYVNSIQLRDVALSPAQMAAMGGPSANGIPQIIPAIPSFVETWTPLGSVARTTTDLGAVINPGEASVSTNTIVLRLNSVVQTGVQISSNGVTGLVTVLKTGGSLTAGNTYNLEVSYTDSQVGAKSFNKQFKAALLFEDFELLPLGDNVQEGLPTVYTNVWTKTPPPGWSIDDSGVPGNGDPANDGVTEWAGWSFASKSFWGVVTDNQGRQNFTLGQGTVAVADPDEWDDAAHLAGTFNTFLLTPKINITGIPAGTLFMKFDSSWDFEDFQVAVIRISYNGGTTNEILRWDSQPGPNFKDTAYNEKVSLLLNNPAGATNVVVFFGMINAGNDWWWAFDNLEINIGDIPSSIFSLTPASGVTNVSPRPLLGAVISPGTTVINPASVQLYLDDAPVATTATTNAQGRTVASARAPAALPKLSVHTNTLVYSDSLNGLQTNRWSFTIANYDEIVLGTPVWMEEFNGVAEVSFPGGWVATNRTTPVNTNFNLSIPGSASYENFVVITTNRLGAVFNANRFNVRPATLNGVAVDTLMSGNLVYGESDNRGGNQVQVLYSPVINLTGITGVKLGFKSIYTQNQDSMGAVEYSIDGGATWLPVLYMLKDQPNDDLIIGDPIATLGTARTDQAWGSNYGAFIGAGPVDASFEPFISGRVDDNQVESKRIEVLALPLADNQANVRLRFTHTGTGSWYFGIDDVGIYGNGAANVFPIIASQPQGGTVADGAPALLVVGIGPTSTRPLSFQWRKDGTNLPNATLQSYSISSMQPSNAGAYRVVITNVAGSVTSDVATLTYLLPVPATITQDPTNSTVTEDLIATFTVGATGSPTLSYQWRFNGIPIAGATSTTLNLQHVAASNAGPYTVVVTNNYGAKTSQVATLTVLPAPPIRITGQWDFNCGTFGATVGSDLVPFNATVLADSQFGTTTSFGIANIGGSPAHVLYFAPSTASWGGYRMYHGAVPNGGGIYVNRYTIIYDIYYPVAGQWRSFLQTSTANANDGDIFVNPANGIGISGTYQGTVLAATWHRIVFTFDLTYNTLKKYIDGTLVGTQILGEGLNGRWSLDPHALLFGDEDGDHDPAYANSIQFRNGVMTDAEVAVLGGATSASGVPGAVPRICSATRVGNTIAITWVGALDIKLQKTTSLSAPNWQDVAGSLGASSANDTIVGDAAYYRLARQQ